MHKVPRFAQEINSSKTRYGENSLQALVAIRELPAWVLLGEPGAGKSTAFEQEADASGGKFLTINQFLHDHEKKELKGKTLFLDALDEIRAPDTSSILIKVGRKLRKLGNPKFRLSCRAADWFGSTDMEDISPASPNQTLAIFLLSPLTREDIETILRKNHTNVVINPRAFIDKAEKLGVGGLLKNPHTLKLLAKAVQDNHWPNSREQTFQLACEKLVEEPNRRHRNPKKTRPVSKEQLLNAAGQLYSVMLLSNKEGIALDPESATDDFPYIGDYAPPQREDALNVLHTNLFRLDAEERVAPAHRSTAEYLAARWLAKQIDQQGLPLGRVLNLLIGCDRRTVAGLRGLYSWLALHCQTIQSRLIKSDPLTVVIYGDVKPFSVENKREILRGFQKEAKQHAAFFQEARSLSSFGALAEPELLEQFSTALRTSARDDGAQSFAICVLMILAKGERLVALVDLALSILKDGSWYQDVRLAALYFWLNTAKDKLALLDELNQGRINDPDNELLGMTLRILYPKYVNPTQVINYLHPLQNSRLTGTYSQFWRHEFCNQVSDSDIPLVLDQLVEKQNRDKLLFNDTNLKPFLISLLSRGAGLKNEKITPERLFDWMTLGAATHVFPHLEKEARKAVKESLSSSPEKYKEFVKHYYQRYRGNAGDANISALVNFQMRLIQDVVIPPNMGSWFLEQASQTDDEQLKKRYFDSAVDALMKQEGDQGLSLEKIEAWAVKCPKGKEWLHPHLSSNIEWQIKEEERKNKRQLEYADRKKKRALHISKHIPDIKRGIANNQIMDLLAHLWWGSMSDAHGDTTLDQFENYSDNGKVLFEATKSGFFLLPERDDLPSVDEIIDLSVKNKRHNIQRPCLVGMEIRWEMGRRAINSLFDNALQQMVAFRLTYRCTPVPEWFIYLVKERPKLVAGVLVPYASKSLKAKLNYIDTLQSLTSDPNYQTVAMLAVPKILTAYPLRANADQHRHLEALLRAALEYDMAPLASLVKKKSRLKSIDNAQRGYWLGTGLLIDISTYESEFWAFIGHSEIRARNLFSFLNFDFHGKFLQKYPLSVLTITKFIELRSSDKWQVRPLIKRLVNIGGEEAEKEISRLLLLPAMDKFKPSLEDARHQIRLKLRESTFQFSSLSDVANILANNPPANVVDLKALILDHLSNIAKGIRDENDDGFRSFWNTDRYGNPKEKRIENICRDELLRRLRKALDPFGIDCQPEADCANDKRADIRASYRNQFDLLIEVKRDDNHKLWSALKSQLINQYAKALNTKGHGIYLVFWFGAGDMAAAKDGGKKPQTPDELQQRLEATLPSEEKGKIAVRVLDVSWPKKP